jgi:hypothetical protein
MTSTPKGPLLSPRAAREYLGGVGKSYYYGLLASGALSPPDVILSERKKFHTIEKLDAFIARHSVTGGGHAE